MSEQSSSPSFVTSLTYKFLLLTTTSAAAFFCWLYITKPTTISAAPEKDELSLSKPPKDDDSTFELNDVDQSPQDSGSVQTERLSNPTDFIPPSDQTLPGLANSAQGSHLSPVNPTRSANIPLANTPSTAGKASWEETNDRVQHIITAQRNGNSERLIIEVPVIYMTRGMRLGPGQAEEARRILKAMEIYQDRINKLQQDGENISKAWNSLLMSTQPVEALRADSPSLPQNNNPSADTLKENSSATISIDE
ncbi:hypothetical protein SAMN02745181_3630 [Rubritalea squalenifaciens DSM 18772]|uniref:Uncharacterized protein n=1 Tax=Rubritalea squalenifaciens DSM 18772 TaxID=1123071 RepID=A0A1M6RLD8_9BACT|nr:hypothetical protein [Rubritalea squalenifaciens]SHK33167.1 hypothetical protein SAMN02745181_3630 [Rubritalea squalenifaciens DSM 18772]